jgi:hypothetical protein
MSASDPELTKNWRVDHALKLDSDPVDQAPLYLVGVAELA